MYEDFRKLLDDLKNNWDSIKSRIQFASVRFFYCQEFISEILFNRNFDNLPKTEFINYANAFAYYESDRKKIKIKYGEKVKEVELPYKELVNYIENPDSIINVDYSNQKLELDPNIISETDVAFNEFIKKRPKTTDGDILGVKGFKKVKSNIFDIKLVKSSYNNLVRINISLDFPLKNNNFKTLRTEDLNDKNNLKSFDDSLLINSIGVSTVLTYRNNGNFYFYMKPRKGKLGVFNNMLSSVSGVVEPPKNTLTELTGFVADEIIRELHEETGLSIDEINKNPQFQIIPLAFTRELTRGGKPQFFFMIMIDKVSEKEFKRMFKKSQGKEEFKDDWVNNIKSYDDFISPEFSTNLIYAYQYIRMAQKKNTEVLELD
jgi:8-oxo-dGTP pyrophosphatase MutT (NUDIX family)